MSTIDKLRTAAADLAEKLTQAEARHTDEQTAIEGRNAQRRTDFWSDAAERVAAANFAARDARQLVLDHLAAGQASAALDAYLPYRLAHVEHEKVSGLAADATAYYVGDRGERVDVAPGAGVPLAARSRVTPPGVGRVADAPTSWEQLLAEGATAYAESHAAVFVPGYLAPLTDALEPEGGR